MERNKIEEFLNSNDIEIVQLGVSLLIEQGVERPEIEELLAPTRFIILISNENGLAVREKEYIAEIFQKVFYNR